MRRLAVLVAVALVASLTVASPALAQPDEFGTVTFVHGVPGAAVDVYVNDELALEDFEFGTPQTRWCFPSVTNRSRCSPPATTRRSTHPSSPARSS